MDWQWTNRTQIPKGSGPRFGNSKGCGRERDLLHGCSRGPPDISPAADADDSRSDRTLGPADRPRAGSDRLCRVLRSISMLPMSADPLKPDDPLSDPATDPLLIRFLARRSRRSRSTRWKRSRPKPFAGCPTTFRSLCEGVIIRIDDFPTQDVVDEMKLESEFDILGLFQGVGLPFRSESAPSQMPNMIWLYRRPILDYWAEHDETLGAIITHVLVHEIGHHFGLSDDDMEAIEASVQ